MKKSGKTRLLSIVLSVAVAVSMMPIMAITASANDEGNEPCHTYLKVTPAVASSAQALKAKINNKLPEIWQGDLTVALKLGKDYADFDQSAVDHSRFIITKKGSKYAIYIRYNSNKNMWTQGRGYLACDAQGNVGVNEDKVKYVWKYNGGFYAYTTETGKVFKKKHYLAYDAESNWFNTSNKKVTASVEYFIDGKDHEYKSYKYKGDGQHTWHCLVCGKTETGSCVGEDFKQLAPGGTCALCEHYKTDLDDVSLFGTCLPVRVKNVDGKYETKYRVHLSAVVINDKAKSIACWLENDETGRDGMKGFLIDDTELESFQSNGMKVIVKTDSNQGLEYKMELVGPNIIPVKTK